MLTSYDAMPCAPYKGRRILDVPAAALLNLYDERPPENEKEKALWSYINANRWALEIEANPKLMEA